MVIVAVEQSFPQEARLIEDDLAHLFLPRSMRILVALSQRFPAIRDWLISAAEKSTPGVWAGILCRTRYIDDKLTKALGAGIDAVANLGAGLDTRAYRLPALARLVVFEVDLPDNIQPKRLRLRKLYGQVPDHVRLVPIDFDREGLLSALTSHSYVTGGKTFFILEGVPQYLTEAGVRRTFDFLAKAAVGSRLVFSYVRKDFLDGTACYGLECIYKRMVAKRQVWRFGMAPERVADFVQDYAWREREHLGTDEVSEPYVKPFGRALRVSGVERIVYAEKL
jgi:methyltransferase (TIGR00027 family)